MRRVLTWVVAGAAIFFVSGCGTSGAGAVAESTTTVPTSTVPLSPRGAIEKTVGEAAGILGGYGDAQKSVEFTLTNMTADVKCTEDWAKSSRPDNGQWVLLDFEVETFAGVPLVPILGKSSFYSVTGDGFVGEVGSSQGDECLPDVSWFGVEDVKPNSKYRVSLLLDVPEDTTAVGYEWDDSLSWEWPIPGV